MWAAFEACAGIHGFAGAIAVMRQLQPSACCSASILIARDRARGMQRDFEHLSCGSRAARIRIAWTLPLAICCAELK